LQIDHLPNIEFITDRKWVTENRSFGGYNPYYKTLTVYVNNRNLADILRTLSHELVHHKQNEDGRLGKDISKEGATGSDIENEANYEAGKVMRWFAKANPQMFKSGYVTESTLTEGINDPAKMKAVFLAGGPGSGKDFIMKKALVGHGLTEVNSDNALEHLMKKRGLNMKMPKSEDYERNLARGVAKTTTKKKEELALAARRGLIINGTADDPDKIARIKAELERNGYETKMLFVNTNDAVSRQRNIERGQQGGRKVPDGTNEKGVPDGSMDIRTEKWEAAQTAKPTLEKLFGKEHFIHVDNSEDIREVSPERRKEIEAQHNELFINYAYHGGSIYDSEFWNITKEKCSERLKQLDWEDKKSAIKTAIDMYGETTHSGLLGWSNYHWSCLDKNFEYNYFKD
jgi:hypothetical protein